MSASRPGKPPDHLRRPPHPDGEDARAPGSAFPGGRERWAALSPEEYGELRRIAEQILKSRRRPGSFQTTSLVHEAYLTLTRPSTRADGSQAELQAMVARAMRSVLADQARKRHAQKRASGNPGLSLDATDSGELPDEGGGDGKDWILVDEALARLEAVDERKSRVVELRFFAGLEVPEIAASLGVSNATVKRDWSFAKAWLYRELQRGETGS